MTAAYKKQVQLLLDVLPEVGKEECFSLHGGTAINLFVRNMPRLSVDIDLTYIEISERTEALKGINAGLVGIKERVQKLRSSIRVQHRPGNCKLLLDQNGTAIKIEVNPVVRGLIGKSFSAQLCEKAQEEFDVFCAMPLVPRAQLFGGKLCAALDRQHPRDLFDVKLLLEHEGFTGEIKRGFLFGLASSNRPTCEMLNPRWQDQRTAFERQFVGMSEVAFSYHDYEATRRELIEIIRASLDDRDKAFLLSLNCLTPDWSTYDYGDFPSVKWKLLNLERFRMDNPGGFRQQLSDLEGLLR